MEDETDFSSLFSSNGRKPSFKCLAFGQLGLAQYSTWDTLWNVRMPQNDDLEKGKAFELSTSSIYVECFWSKVQVFVGGMGGLPRVGGGSKRNIKSIKSSIVFFNDFRSFFVILHPY